MNLDEICNDINAILKKYNVDISVSPQMVNLHSNGILSFEKVGDCPFKKNFYFNNTAKLVDVYAYKSAQRAIDMLNNDILYFTSLEKNEDNDYSEYSEFFHRTGFFEQFIPNGYVKGKTPLYQPKLPIDIERENTYIYCLTNTFNKTRHWKEYANYATGVCIEYSFEFKSRLNQCIDFNYGRIVYDTGYLYDYLKEINWMLRRKYQLSFCPTGIRRFAAMYKREKYSWEDESRIVLFGKDPSEVSKSTGSKLIDACNSFLGGNPLKEERLLTKDNGFQVIKPGVLQAQNNNVLFKWNVERVIAGERIYPNELSQLVTICNKRNIKLYP